ncbi:MAG: RNA methyltransferase [Pseudomonadota bacterium]
MSKDFSFYVGLVHYPTVNKNGEEIITSVTNLDIHDIARSCRTFGVKKYFLINPLEPQREVAERILQHWRKDQSNQYNPDRCVALQTVQWAYTIAEAREIIEKEEQKAPLVAVTSAQFKEADGDVKSLLTKIFFDNELDNRPLFLLFGTGWGLSASVVNEADFRLVPIFSHNLDGYNHLSVRSAVAIYLEKIRAAQRQLDK